MALPTAPNSYDEFNSQAHNFAQKAKEQGLDNTTIANTIMFMYKMTQDNIAQNRMTPAQQAQTDLEKQKLALAQKGTWSYNSDDQKYYNSVTGETRDSFPGGAPTPGSYIGGNGSQSTQIQNSSGVDPAALADAHKSAKSANTSTSSGPKYSAPSTPTAPKAAANTPDWKSKFLAAAQTFSPKPTSPATPNFSSAAPAQSTQPSWMAQYQQYSPQNFLPNMQKMISGGM